MEKWIREQERNVQLDFFRRLTHFLSNQEIVQVMEGINKGRDIVDVHIEMGLLLKYSVELPRIKELVFNS